jgi:hypothetical protein
MMDIFFSDPNDVPLPPDQIHIREFEARAYSDLKRVAVRYEISPFMEKPNIEISIENGDGDQLAELSVVEVMDTRMDFTMHLKGGMADEHTRARIVMFYNEMEEFNLEAETLPTPEEFLNRVKNIVDQKEIPLTIIGEIK